MKKKIILIILILISAFVILKLLDKNTQWKVIQYGDNIGAQMMCYTIEGNRNGLIIVDGGYIDNEEQVNYLKNKIDEHNGKVDAWILTHFDSDHAGVFMNLVKDNNVSIEKVFVQDAPTDLSILQENASWEDDWDTYLNYLELDLPQKIKVHSGDNFTNIIGLDMKVLCSYEDWIDEKTNNLLNNGSIVFKLYGKENSMLFCSDTQNKEISDYLIENYKKDLKSDYLQVGHHGNNWFAEEFYQLVSPSVAFFSAPDWLINNEGQVSWFTAEKNKELLEELGTKIYWHNTAPNEVLLY